MSHTHVPTESRPGHVAIIAGFYEDVSAVTRGWQENPVEFDSVFNQSRHTWSWGSPDILPMFAKGAARGRVTTYMYGSEEEDFANLDASRLDLWVFDKVKEFFNEASSNSHLMQQLQEDGNVFFLHLLGIDTNGHAHRPYSDDYINNVRFVDQGIMDIVAVFESFFQDGSTAYVFTSDHGMTDWGSHGAGLPEETMTPLVAWGAGIRPPTQSTEDNKMAADSYSLSWGLSHLKQSDVNQADIAPLMSTLIGRPIPVNSEGILPVDFLVPDGALRAWGLYTNARQLCEQVLVKHIHVLETSLKVFLRPYPKLHPEDIAQWQDKIEMSLKSGQFEESLKDTKVLIGLAEEAIQYYNKYHRTYLFIVLSLAFIGWMVSILTVIQLEFTPQSVEKTNMPTSHKTTYNYALISMSTVIVLLLYIQSSPVLHYVYTLMTVFLWFGAVSEGKAVLRLLSYVWYSEVLSIYRFAILFFIIEGIVLSFFHRWSLSLLLVAVSLWPFTSFKLKQQRSLCVGWLVNCLALAAFPLLPTVGRNPMYMFVHVASVLVLVAVIWMGRVALAASHFEGAHYKRFTFFQSAGIVLASVLVEVTRYFISSKSSVPLFVHVCSWLLLLQSIITPFFSAKSVTSRLAAIFLALMTPYILLSNSFEAIFVLLLGALLFQWIVLEQHLSPKVYVIGRVDVDIHRVSIAYKQQAERRQYFLKYSDIRRVVMPLFFGVLSFFGTGNIASINTFDPSYVYCFKTVFSPFIMGALIIFKIVIPFLLVGCALNLVLLLAGQPQRLSLLLTMVLSDIMGLQFFFLVQDEGSWLDIGISISHYVIIMCVAGGVVIVMGVSRLFTGTSVTLR